MRGYRKYLVFWLKVSFVLIYNDGTCNQSLPIDGPTFVEILILCEISQVVLV